MVIEEVKSRSANRSIRNNTSYYCCTCPSSNSIRYHRLTPLAFLPPRSFLLAPNPFSYFIVTLHHNLSQSITISSVSNLFLTCFNQSHISSCCLQPPKRLSNSSAPSSSNLRIKNKVITQLLQWLNPPSPAAQAPSEASTPAALQAWPMSTKMKSLTPSPLQPTPPLQLLPQAPPSPTPPISPSMLPPPTTNPPQHSAHRSQTIKASQTTTT